MNVGQEHYILFSFSASSFSFPHPENCHIIFVFSCLVFPQPRKLSRGHFYALNQIHLNSFAHNFMCELPMFHLSSLFSAFFFSDMVFPFAFNLEQHPIVCPLKFRIKGCFSLSYCPQISLRHVSSWHHRTCRIAWHLMEFKVMLVYKRHRLLSLV